MLSHRMRLVASGLATHMSKTALVASGTLPKIVVEADGFVGGDS